MPRGSSSGAAWGVEGEGISVAGEGWVMGCERQRKREFEDHSSKCKEPMTLLNTTSPFGSTSLCQVRKKVACSLFKRKLKEKISEPLSERGKKRHLIKSWKC